MLNHQSLRISLAASAPERHKAGAGWVRIQQIQVWMWCGNVPIRQRRALTADRSRARVKGVAARQAIVRRVERRETCRASTVSSNLARTLRWCVAASPRRSRSRSHVVPRRANGVIDVRRQDVPAAGARPDRRSTGSRADQRSSANPRTSRIECRAPGSLCSARRTQPESAARWTDSSAAASPLNLGSPERA